MALTMTPARQPFASLETPRLRSLLKTQMNVKNQQNGNVQLLPEDRHQARLTDSSGMAMKMQISVDDAENVDPATASLSTKRKRALDDVDEDHEKASKSREFIKPIKSSRTALSSIETTLSNTIATLRGLSTPATPISARPSTPKTTTPFARPAGRSPQSKSCKAFTRRSHLISKSTARPEPASRRSVGRPFSIATALAKNQLQQQLQPKPTPKKASWYFEIHVDSEQEEMTNLMQHSTGVLDISDDDSTTRQAKQGDVRGKENIPPSELGLDIPVSSATRSRARQSMTASPIRKAIKMDEDRSPLEELNAAEYYAADCHAFSVAVVYDDDEACADPVKADRPESATCASIAEILQSSTVQPEDKPSKETQIEIHTQA
ncbi:hypothetical protein ASPZODRAFT_60500 [Penicilliopsis zonata CBS 506.65]|uniref:Uncharacterized protein n=1 Tax=Penicilliopsis zonata CBS 506.65 TaxID=1073090 RepID=A0A1L9SPH3_9EURO|nr:hypothetical protein ASPZODRAFT_60500 [Penicilliopsis zonata CBS 506.65]OJJ49001.1 hypothetical protein ASPZODRAFT_60500 [Penicilliopsis zonata CBS 506.65]